MIRVKVELVPYGDEQRAKQIGELVLANVHSVGMGTCIYDAVYKTENRHPFSVRGVRHHRQDGFWELLRLILSEEAEEITEEPTVNSSLHARIQL